MMAEAGFNEAGEVQALGPVGWKPQSWRTVGGGKGGGHDPASWFLLPRLWLQHSVSVVFRWFRLGRPRSLTLEQFSGFSQPPVRKREFLHRFFSFRFHARRIKRQLESLVSDFQSEFVSWLTGLLQ